MAYIGMVIVINDFVLDQNWNYISVSHPFEALRLPIWDVSESVLAPVPSSNLIVPTPAIPVLPLIDLATLELPADQQEPTELTLFGLKKSALDPSLVGFQDLEIRHGASEQVNDSLLTLFFNSSSTCVSPTRWWRTHWGCNQVEDRLRETPWIHLKRWAYACKQLSSEEIVLMITIMIFIIVTVWFYNDNRWIIFLWVPPCLLPHPFAESPTWRGEGISQSKLGDHWPLFVDDWGLRFSPTPSAFNQCDALQVGGQQRRAGASSANWGGARAAAAGGATGVIIVIIHHLNIIINVFIIVIEL